MWKKTKEYSSRQLRRAGVVIDNATGQVVGTIGGLAVAGSAMAVPVDLTSLTASVDFSTATAAILLVFAALAGVYIAWKAGKMVLTALKGG